MEGINSFFFLNINSEISTLKNKNNRPKIRKNAAIMLATVDLDGSTILNEIIQGYGFPC